MIKNASFYLKVRLYTVKTNGRMTTIIQYDVSLTDSTSRMVPVLNQKDTNPKEPSNPTLEIHVISAVDVSISANMKNRSRNTWRDVRDVSLNRPYSRKRRRRTIRIHTTASIRLNMSVGISNTKLNTYIRQLFCLEVPLHAIP